ncbi:hypothetical protein [Tindallia californiensis]|uniref:Uncharacterized protein n=1 Tax=Tindallia californiensis TaxID=159292 RepID=A0A1H3PSM3_9FIRM|nr:hypothetical protein [Tindallia californiensis]SDZ03943.1 hypothetical protein SAMN05192546_10763 [Tindallia californiensis]
MEEKKGFWEDIGSNSGIIVFLLLLLMQMYRLDLQVSRIDNQLHHLVGSNEIAMLSHEIQQLNQEEAMIFNESWSVNAVDLEKQLITLHYEWSLREVWEDAQIGLQLLELERNQGFSQEQGVHQWTIKEAEMVGLNRFQAEIEVSPAHDYQVQPFSKGAATTLNRPSSVPYYLYQPPNPSITTYSIHHSNEPNYQTGDKYIGFRLDEQSASNGLWEEYPELRYLPKTVEAEFRMNGKVFQQALREEEEESLIGGEPSGETLWILDFPAHKGSAAFENLILTVEYHNGIRLSYDKSEELYLFLPEVM